MNRPLRNRGALIVAGLALLGSALGCSSPRESEEPYNLVLITLDTTRADFLRFHGATNGEQPVLDAMAAESIVFERAIAPNTITVPSHASILTGLYPRQHGVLHNVQSLDGRWTTLAEMFSARGARTAAFLGARGIIRKNLARGFDLVDDEVPESEPLSWQRAARWTNDLALPWLTENAEDPYFLWVHYYDPHSPMPPSERSAAAYPAYDGRFADGMEVEELGPNQHDLTEADLAYLRALYEDEITALDRELGRLMDALRASGTWDRTVLVLTADHGQSLGEDAFVGHGGPFLPEAQIHVPLLVRLPPSLSDPAWRTRVPWPVSLTDILPTLLELFPDLTPPEYPLAGRSLLDLLEPHVTDDAAIVFAEAPANLIEDVVEPQSVFQVRQGDWKLVVSPDGRALYDLANDPQERNPLDATTERGVALEQELEAWLHEVGELRAAAIGEVDDDLLEALEALGYTGG